MLQYHVWEITELGVGWNRGGVWGSSCQVIRPKRQHRHTAEILQVHWIPDHLNKVGHNVFADGGSCPPSVENATPVKHNKGERNKRKYARM